MMQESPQLLEYVFKTIVAIGITVATFYFKDFRTTLTKLTENLQSLTISVSTLVERDSTREHVILDLRKEVDTLKERVTKLEKDLIRQEVMHRRRE